MDSKSLLDIITKCSETQERHSMTDQQAVSHEYAVHDINNVVSISVPNNPADCLTKIGKFHAFNHLLLAGKCDFIIGPRIICCKNAAKPTSNSSTASIFYVRSYIIDVIHPSRCTASSYMRTNQFACLRTVLFELTEHVTVPFMEFMRTFAIFCFDCTAPSLDDVLHTKRLL